MKNVLYFFAAILLMASCTDPIEDPEIRVYQVTDNNDITIPVTTEDHHDGTGFLIGQLLFTNNDTRFTAILDYVNDNKTNFSLTIEGNQTDYTFVSGTGNFTSDSIFISIYREVSGIDIEETYVGSR